ncbi:MAG TPA: 2-(1,2-epoxy-1,2-dihydrophenyl)acetyl-CoA isomerase PaaG [Burkholderiales bacterium]|nr:2-(1,2-epoxy-1,2-dihydrophenyl)acetyl-CoA isomerase PaaG [Burkholderiales bacterium]
MDPVLVSLEGNVLRWTLNRPERLNAFSLEMHAALREAMARAEQDAAVRCVLVTGAGRAFCAGADLAGRDVNPAQPIDLGATLESNYNPLVLRMRALPKPIVCAVNGVAAGAGANFALACDIVLAARSASFIQAFVKIGLVPDCGGSYFLPRLAGTQRAMALAMTGDRLPAEDAERWGVIWKCVDDGDLMAEAGKLAQQLAAGPTRTLGLIKQQMYASAGNALGAQLQLERELQRKVGEGEDWKEGVAAFQQKRKPSFQGR